MIDVGQILTAAGTVVVASGLVLVAAKHLLEKIIDARFKRSDDRYKAELDEMERRRAALYDLQIDILQRLTKAAYEIRDTSKEFISPFQDDITKAESSLLSIVCKFEDHLREARSLLPDNMFQVEKPPSRVSATYQQTRRLRYIRC